jgi:hypothetical protein
MSDESGRTPEATTPPDPAPPPLEGAGPAPAPDAPVRASSTPSEPSVTLITDGWLFREGATKTFTASGPEPTAADIRHMFGRAIAYLLSAADTAGVNVEALQNDLVRYRQEIGG